MKISQPLGQPLQHIVVHTSHHLSLWIKPMFQDSPHRIHYNDKRDCTMWQTGEYKSMSISKPWHLKHCCVNLNKNKTSLSLLDNIVLSHMIIH